MEALEKNTTTRVLVKDGKWLVPVEQRPKNWQAILPESAEPTVAKSATVQPAPEPQPILDAVAEVTEARVAEPSLPTKLCGCGKPEKHLGMCKVRAAKAAHSKAQRKAHLEKMRESWSELNDAIVESAKWFGAGRDLTEAAMVLACGIYTRNYATISQLTGVKIRRTTIFADGCLRTGLWLDDGNVILGDFDSEHGELEFWLNAMCVNGDLVLAKVGESGTYAAVRYDATAEAVMKTTEPARKPATEKHYRQACAWAYQYAGATDAPVYVLDNLAALARGEKSPHRWRYPVPMRAAPAKELRS